MAGRERDWDENANGSPDPETLYTKEYCIGGGSFGKVYKGCVPSFPPLRRG